MRSCSRSLAGVCATVRLGFGAAVRGRRGLQLSHIAAGRKHKAGAQQRRRSQEAATSLHFAPCCTMRQISHWNHDPIGLDRIMPPSLCLRMTKSKTGAQFSDHALFPAQHLNLPHPKQFDPWSSPRPDIAADTNPFIFEGLRPKSGRLERRYDAP